MKIATTPAEARLHIARLLNSVRFYLNSAETPAYNRAYARATLLEIKAQRAALLRLRTATRRAQWIGMPAGVSYLSLTK